VTQPDPRTPRPPAAAAGTRRPPTIVPPPPGAIRNVPPAPAPPSPARPRQRRVQYHPDARLSTLALIGATWASLFFLMLILSALRGNTIPLPEVRPPMWHALLDYVLQPLGWSAPIASTVLGLLAIGQIQKADGAKYGLSLALFDALVFPMLLLDGFVYWVYRQIAEALIVQDIVSAAVVGRIGPAIPVVIIILGDYYLATRSWRLIQGDEAEGEV